MTDPDELMMPGEVAALFRVNASTVTRWAQAGLIGHQRTPGGRYRFPRKQVLELLDNNTIEATR